MGLRGYCGLRTGKREAEGLLTHADYSLHLTPLGLLNPLVGPLVGRDNISTETDMANWLQQILKHWQSYPLVPLQKTTSTNLISISFRVGIEVEMSHSDSRPKISDSDSYSRSFPNVWFRFRFRFQEFSKCLIPIPIPVKSATIPESIPIPESESCITDRRYLLFNMLLHTG